MGSTPPPPSESQLRTCEGLIAKSLDESPMVRILVRAMEARGCALNPARHIACENCSGDLAGGFDVEVNQVVICANKCGTAEKVTQILTHELVHMFDHCSAKVDFTNIEHLACSEVRAANLAHCKPFGLEGSLLGSRDDCVREKAARSVSLIKGVSSDVAMKAVGRVFFKCRNDLEPIGRVTYNTESELCALREFNSIYSKVKQCSEKRKAD